MSAQSERSTRCEYCESLVFIPDALWKQLHPVKQVDTWFVIYDDPPAPNPPAPRPSSPHTPAFEPDPDWADDHVVTEPMRTSSLVWVLIPVLMGLAITLIALLMS